MNPSDVDHRQYPIGALSANEMMGILAQPLCADKIGLDNLMQDWRNKNQMFRTTSMLNLNIQGQTLQSLNVSPDVLIKIQNVITSYRYYLPANFELAFVPLDTLIVPQKSVLLERAGKFLPGMTGPITDDQNAELCLGTPVYIPEIRAEMLGSGINPQNPNQFTFVYQFESADQDIRYLGIPPLENLKTVDLSPEKAPHKFTLKSIPITVGPGTPLVQVFKVQIGFMPSPQGIQVPIYRFILHNGVHRAFRLAQLGNKYIAALVHEVTQDELPNILVDTPKGMLFSQRPLLIKDLADSTISRTFDWKKAKSLVKLQITVNAEKWPVPE